MQSSRPSCSRATHGKATSAGVQAERFAFVVSLCNQTDYYGKGGEAQLQRAINLLATLRALHSKIEPIAIVHSFSALSISRLVAAGWHVRGRWQRP